MKTRTIFDGRIGNMVSSQEQAMADFEKQLEGTKGHVSEQQLTFARASWANSLMLGATETGNIIVAIGNDHGFAACEFELAKFEEMWDDVKERIGTIPGDDLHGVVTTAVRQYLKERLSEEERQDHALEAASTTTLLTTASLLYEMHRRIAEEGGGTADQFSSMPGAGLVLFAHVADAIMPGVKCMIFSSRWHVPVVEPGSEPVGTPATFHSDKMGHA